MTQDRKSLIRVKKQLKCDKILFKLTFLNQYFTIKDGAYLSNVESKLNSGEQWVDYLLLWSAGPTWWQSTSGSFTCGHMGLKRTLLLTDTTHTHTHSSTHFLSFSFTFTHTHTHTHTLSVSFYLSLPMFFGIYLLLFFFHSFFCSFSFYFTFLNFLHAVSFFFLFFLSCLRPLSLYLSHHLLISLRVFVSFSLSNPRTHAHTHTILCVNH